MPFSFADQIDREYARTRQEPDEASDLRLSIIEHLDRQHADAVELLDRIAKEWPYATCLQATWETREHALWSALEIVRDLEGVQA